MEIVSNIDEFRLFRLQEQEMYNIIIGWYGHETNTFNPLPTTIERFGGPEYVLSAEDCSNLHSFNRAYAKVLRERSDVNIIPTVSAWAEPWGRVERSAHEYIKGRILAKIRECGRVDGVLLALHGAMVLEDDEDGEGDLLEAVRRGNRTGCADQCGSGPSCQYYGKNA